MIRLLIVDDSALMRKLLADIFVAEGDFDVRLARNGTEALELVKSFDPQVVTLDVQMPGIDGLECLSRIMIEAPRPVVMISSLTEEGAEATLEAMALGALDFVAKPSGTVSLEIDRLKALVVDMVRGASRARIRPTLRLAERVRHRFHGGTPSARGRRPRGPALAVSPEAASERGLVLIGSSTGGPAALDLVLPRLPKEFPWPILIAQHMPASFTGPFAKRLDRECALRVVEVNQPMLIEPGTIYIARGDADLVVARRSKGISAMSVPGHPDYPWHPSVERMVGTAMDHYEANRLIGVLLTGMGRDGADAMTRLNALGGHTIAEAESTAAVWGMPGELVKAGGAGRVAAIDDVAEMILDRVESNAVR